MWAGAVRGWGRCPPPPLARPARQAGRHTGRSAPRAVGGGGPNEAVSYACAYSVVYLSMRRQRCAGRVAADAARGGPRPRPAHGQPGRGRRLWARGTRCAGSHVAGRRYAMADAAVDDPPVGAAPASEQPGGGGTAWCGAPRRGGGREVGPGHRQPTSRPPPRGGLSKGAAAGRPPSPAAVHVGHWRCGRVRRAAVAPAAVRPGGGGCRLSFPLLLLLPAIARR